jgi:iron complex outermembrane receptor protein
MLRVRSGLIALLATFALAGQLAAQATGTVTGRIVNASTQEPIARVRVTVADRTAPTNIDGRFSITGVVAGTHVLRATYLGYREALDTISVSADRTTTVDLTMEPVAVELANLVVIGYGEQEKGDLTGVVAEVSADQFNTGRVISAEGLIRGKVAGVQVSESNGGEPGGGISVRIRGATSISSSNEPLYVVDGVPLPVGGGLSGGRNPINFINPNDIESMTVLKDASATAIYGSQGANGVVMITTRSGRGAVATASGWSMTYRGTMSGSNVVGQPSILTPDQFRQAVLDQQPAADSLLGSASTDWLKEVERSAFGQEHTVVVSGGAEKTSLRASLGYLKQDGVVRASNSERISLNLAFNQLLFNDHLSLQANLAGARTKDRFTPGGVLGSAINMAPTQPILDSTSQFDGYFEWDDPLATNNPVAMLNQISDEGVSYRSLGNLTGVYNVPFVSGLSATARLGFGVTNAERRYFAPSTTKVETENNGFGTVNRANPSETSSLFDAFLTYDRQLGTEHAVTVTGGYGYSQRRQDSPFFQARQLASDMLGPNGVPTAGLIESRLFVQESKLSSWFARAN